jgi:hypothetical protein
MIWTMPMNANVLMDGLDLDVKLPKTGVLKIIV